MEDIGRFVRKLDAHRTEPAGVVMSLTDTLKSALDQAKDKASELAGKHGSTIDSGLDKVGAMADKATKGKYNAKIYSGRDKAKEAVHRVADKDKTADKAHKLADDIAEKAHKAADKAHEVADKVADKAHEVADEVADKDSGTPGTGPGA
jgi:methyl-accepting chemotaxis protein